VVLLEDTMNMDSLIDALTGIETHVQYVQFQDPKMLSVSPNRLGWRLQSRRGSSGLSRPSLDATLVRMIVDMGKCLITKRTCMPRFLVGHWLDLFL
jgi:hypothetical protein